MTIGIIGSGNMARALVLGWGEPVLCTDLLPGRAEALAGEVGGEAVGSNAALAERADLVVLAHKPAQLGEVAREIGGTARAVVSILGGVPLSALHEAYPDTPLVRVIPSTPAEVGQGATCHAADPQADPETERTVLDLFRRVGPVFTVEERLMDVATATMSCAPAFLALVAEAQVDAAVRGGLPAPLAAELVSANLAGTAALLAARGHDTLAVRRLVTSPGGSTARGLAALERRGVRAAFSEALDAVTGGGR